MRWLADLVYLLAGVAYLPAALYQAVILGKNRRGWRERFGRLPGRTSDKRRIWIHAVSLGEINATPRLVEALRQRLPDADIVFSTTTDTGHARAVQLYGADRVFRFPLDFSLVVTRVLRRVRPSMIVLVELEVWFNLVHQAARRAIPVAVVNGRLTERSARRLGRLGPFARSMFQRLTWIGAQDETIASRFADLGVPRERIQITASLKWDSAEVTDHVDGEEALARTLGINDGRPLWVCGSTGPCEEPIILRAYRQVCERTSPPRAGRSGSARQRGAPSTATPNTPGRSRSPLLAIVPRKPERFDEVARLIEQAGFACIRRSQQPDGTSPHGLSDNAVILGDTMGELRKFYSLADVVFVGRTLVPMGGSDPMEVAALAKPMVIGPHVENFKMPVDALRAADALRTVDSPESLARAVMALLESPSTTRALGARARQVVLDHQGATERTANALVDLLKTRDASVPLKDCPNTGLPVG